MGRVKRRRRCSLALAACLALVVPSLLPAQSIAPAGDTSDVARQDDRQAALRALEDELGSMVRAATEGRRRIEPETLEGMLAGYLEQFPAAEDIGTRPSAATRTYFEIARFATRLAPDLDAGLPQLAEQAAAAGVTAGSGAQAGADILFPDPLESALRYLINARDFHAAKAFAGKHRIEVPNWIAGAPSEGRASGDTAHVYRFERRGGQIEASLERADVATGAWMVVEVSPHCGFSKRAMRLLSENGPLADGFPQDRVLWVVSQDQSSAVPAMVDWNDAHPGLEMVLVHRGSDWPEPITFLRFPVFNFLRDGELVDQVAGWPGDEQLDAVRAGIARLSGNGTPLE